MSERARVMPRPFLAMSVALLLSTAAHARAQNSDEASRDGADGLADPVGTPTTPSGYGGRQRVSFPVVRPSFAPPVSVAPPPVHQNMITTDPVAAFQGLLILRYQRALGESVSFYVGPEFLLPDVFIDGLSGGGLILGVDFHLIGPAPTGVWIGPRFEVLVLDDGADRGLGVMLGGMLGYTWQWGHFTLSVGAGSSYVRFELAGSVVSDGLIATGRTAVGYAF
ncbi:MAG: hypothetical protein GXP55_20935 [Deltaproteobacteria bacterium]|nr:hypothetical protein [Deltaproteobacteria bacterium]